MGSYAPELGLMPGTAPASPEAVLAAVKALALSAVSSPHSRRAYGKALDDFLSWLAKRPGAVFQRAVVQEYRAAMEARGWAASTINVRLAAIRKLAAEAAENGLLAPEVAAGILRVKGVRQSGVRVGNWLSREEAQRLLAQPDRTTLKGKRDRALLALLVGCGLRRAEAARLTVDRLQRREGRWVIADITGKGGRVRTAPVPAWVYQALAEWLEAAGVESGPVLRAVSKGGRVRRQGLSEKAIWWVVEEHARAAGLGKLAPHDLRRTCAKLCRAAGGELEQIQFLLGHASIQTTERYLGARQNLADAPNDHLGLG